MFIILIYRIQEIALYHDITLWRNARTLADYVQFRINLL